MIDSANLFGQLLEFLLSCPLSSNMSDYDMGTYSYIVSVSTVAIAVNGVATISKSIRKLSLSKETRVRDIFLKFTLKLISRLSEENEQCREKLAPLADPQSRKYTSSELQSLTDSQRKIEVNDETLKNAVRCYQTVSSQLTIGGEKAQESFKIFTFIFMVISIFVLTFSPQIGEWKVYNAFFLLLLLPQLVALLALLNALIGCLFPIKYILLVWSVSKGKENCPQAIKAGFSAVMEFETRILGIGRDSDSISQNANIFPQ